MGPVMKIAKSETDQAHPGPRLSVLYSVPPPSARSNPYTTLLGQAVSAEGAEVQYFSWKRALFGRYDVLHVHWPETLVRSPGGGLRRAARLSTGFAYLARLALTKTPVVWTVHNRTPHESGSRLDRLFTRGLLKRVDHRIYLNSSEPLNTPSTVVLHGTYGPWYKVSGRATRNSSRLLFFGMIRPYKGIETFIDAFKNLTPEDGLEMRIVGEPDPTTYGEALIERIGADPATSFDLRRLGDDELASEVGTAGVVVLPYRTMYNSGALILALSLGTHVLAPASPANRTLLQEFGDRWITLFEGEVTAQDLRLAAVSASQISEGELPNMVARQWHDAGAAHRTVYEAVAARRKRYSNA